MLYTEITMNYKNKKAIVFDLDGTLTKSKSNLDEEMSALLCRLLDQKIVAVMGGGNYYQFQNQLLALLNCTEAQYANLFVLPVSGGSLYRYNNGQWSLVYENRINDSEKIKIFEAFDTAFKEMSYVPPQEIFGDVIEYRGSQVTFSALGQKAPEAVKKDWNTNHDIRPQLQEILKKYLPEFEIRLGGLTSVDVTQKGIDKAFGLEQLAKLLYIPIEEMLYVGDALYEGGNDAAVIRTGVETKKVENAEETKILIKEIIL